jgi:protein TonB
MSTHIARSGYQSQGKLSPAAIGGVLLVHAGLGAVIFTMSAVKIIDLPVTTIWVRNIPKEKPKRDPVPAKPTPPTKDQRITATQPAIDFLTTPPVDVTKPPIVSTEGSAASGIDTGPTIIPPDPPPPVIVQAKPDQRFASGFQPSYPAAMVRMQMEGAVTVRVTIGADGRVQDVALISAVDPAFYEATRKQALNRWRFVPATRDGVAIASERVMTVHFRLTD